MKKYYIGVIRDLKNKDEIFVRDQFKQEFGFYFSVNSQRMDSVETDQLKSFVRKIEPLVKERISPYTRQQLHRILMFSEGAYGIGGCAMTKYNCKVCGKEEIHGSTCTPLLCEECRDKAVTRIIDSEILLKEKR